MQLFAPHDTVRSTFRPAQVATWAPADRPWLHIAGFALAFLAFSVAGATALRCVRALRIRLGEVEQENCSLQDELQVVQDFSTTLAEFDEETNGLKATLEEQNAALAAANERLELLATTDALTGLANHRAIMEALEREEARARCTASRFAILFVDLDHFKALNDTCGHVAGDATLRELGTLMRSTLGPLAVIGRWGGEEFLAMLPEVPMQRVDDIGEQLRAGVANHPFGATGGGRVTCSVGLAVFPDDSETASGLVAAADRAMYAAKRLGRNQVRAAREPCVIQLANAAEAGDAREDAALVGMVEALAALVEARDLYSAQHSRAVATLAGSAAQALGLGPHEVRLVEIAARLQDIGKVAVPDAILSKVDGPLDEEEWRMLRTHPIVGAEIVSRVPALRVLAPLIRSHHERWDGAGYPDGLAGETIPRGARIGAVADAYRALTADRPYQHGRAPVMALAELQRCAGSQFDAEVVAALAAALDRVEVLHG